MNTTEATKREKREYLKKHIGQRFYAKVSRMGGMFTDIHALALYEINKNGAPQKIEETMGCLANKDQYKFFDKIVKNCGYINGRPTIDKVYAELQFNKNLFK